MLCDALRLELDIGNAKLKSAGGCDAALDRPADECQVCGGYLGFGRRVRVGAKRIFMRDDVERCIREVMDGEKSEDVRENSRRWRDLAKKAWSEGGSSDQNLNKLVEYLNAKARNTIPCSLIK